MREYQTLEFKPKEHIRSKDFSAKNIRFKMREMRELQTFMFQSTDSLCSDTFQPKIFTSKLKRIA